MTVAADPRPDPMPKQPDHEPETTDDHPVAGWSTATVRSVLADGDLLAWQRVVAAIHDDPYGRTAGQVAEVIGDECHPGVHDGVAAALSEVLRRTRAELEADERAEVARHMRVLLRRSGLERDEFAARIGVSPEQSAAYLEAEASPPASLMIRMRRLCDRAAAAATGAETGAETEGEGASEGEGEGGGG